VPKTSASISKPKNIELVPASTLREAIKLGLVGKKRDALKDEG
jgi:hypothetical protein